MWFLIFILGLIGLICGFIHNCIGLFGEVIPKLFWFFIIKNIIQDVIIGWIKNHENFLVVLGCLIIDIIRVIVFFYIFNQCFIAYQNAGGFSIFVEMLNVVIVFVVGGIYYLALELVSCLSHRKAGDIPKLIEVNIETFVLIGMLYFLMKLFF